MRGIAQNHFQHKLQSVSWNHPPKYAPPAPWPLVERLVQAGFFSYLDYAFAEKMARACNSFNQDLGAFLSYLFLSVRLGHLCMKINQEQIVPHPADLLALLRASSIDQTGSVDMPEIDREEIDRLQTMIRNGFQNAPGHLLSHVEREDVFSKTPLCSWKGHIYLQKNWMLETMILHQLHTHASAQPLIQASPELVRSYLDKLIGTRRLLPEQEAAILQSFRHTLSLVTGGPGTGKTYTAGQFVNLFWSSLEESERNCLEIVLAAPTGKAAARLHESLVKVLSHEQLLQHISAKTLHSLLGIRKNKNFDAINPSLCYLSADLVIVDESSMMDVRLMACLLGALKMGSRLIMLGDKDQLPPVEAGNLFADLVSAYENHSNNLDQDISVSRLSKCMRSDMAGILNLAAAVNDGKSEAVLDMLNHPPEGIGRFAAEAEYNLKSIQQMIVSLAAIQSQPHETDLSVDALMARLSRFKILCPLRKGPLGVDTLNCLCKNEIERAASASKNTFIAPIMITVNDYRSRLHNGEMGLLVRKHGERTGCAIFPGNEGQETEIRTFSLHALPAFEYAYCISVHKSQGSEFDEALIVMPDGAEYFGREVLYTAITRAKKRVQIYGSDAVIKAAVDRRGLRLSGIPERALNTIPKRKHVRDNNDLPTC